MWSIHTIEYYSATKSSDTCYKVDELKHHTNWNKPDAKGIYCITPLMWNVQTGKIHKTESRLEVNSPWEKKRKKSYCFIDTQFLLGVRKAFQVVGGDGCEHGEFFFFWSFFTATHAAHGSSQARSQIQAMAASLRHSHRNAGSELHLWPTPQLMVMPDP